jgi:hypothetical protein
MSCCGRKRLALVSGRGDAPTSQAGAAVAGVAASTRAVREPRDVVLRYLALGAFSTRSARTGRAYACAGTGAAVSVDPRDAESLLRTGLFTRA